MSDTVDTVALVTAGLRSERRMWGWVGIPMLLLGVVMMGLVMTAKGGLLGRIGGAALFGLVFALPGVLMLRKRFQAISSAPMIQLLTTRRSDIVRAYPRYVSYGGGPTTAQLHLVDNQGKDHSVMVPLLHIKTICRQLAQEGIAVTAA